VRAVVDTNVLVSGLFWRGPPRALMEMARTGALRLVTSPTLLAELADVLIRPRFKTKLARSGTDDATVLADLRLLAEIIDPPPISAPASRDPDDDAVLALAVAAQADLVITGDNDLLDLGTYVGIPIVRVAEALARIAAS
jgi:uncharacterized protein